MATLAAELMVRCVVDGSLSLNDGDIERRPYHKSCGCALHKLKGVCSDACTKQMSISFPMKKSWPDCSLSTKRTISVASNFSSSQASQCSSDSTTKLPIHVEEKRKVRN